MARNRTPHPSAIALAVDRLAGAISIAATDLMRSLRARDELAESDARLAAAVGPELMAARHVSVADLGRWIEIPDPLPLSQATASVKVTAGRLVGIRPGAVDAGVAYRVFVIQQGAESAGVRAVIDYPVRLV